MSNRYIKFTDPETRVKRVKASLGKRILRMLLVSFIPVGNSQFEAMLVDVTEWLLEFEDENQYPTREIGLNYLKQPIMIMPWRRNYGYWVDDNLLIKDFETRFNAVAITQFEFELHWNAFLEQNEK